MLARLARRSFFKANISRIHGQKCCPYKQNGKPLSQDKVQEFLAVCRLNPDQTAHWVPNEDFTRLTRSFYLHNIFMAVEFIKDIYEMDSQTTQQIPNIAIVNQDLVRVELYTPELKGLSFRDFELASIVDSFDLKKYNLTPLAGEKGYKKVIRRMRLDQDNQSIDDEIARSAGGSRFGSKFKSGEFQRQFEGK